MGEFLATYKPGRGEASVPVTVLVDDADIHVAKWTWRVTRGGHVYRNFSYREKGLKKCRRIYLHRYLMNLQPHHRRVVDHINNNGLDNRRQNLQVVTRKVNTLRAYRRDHVELPWNRAGWLEKKKRRVRGWDSAPIVVENVVKA